MMATPNPRIQALILNSRIKEKLQTEMKKKKKQNESNKQAKQAATASVGVVLKKTPQPPPQTALVTRLDSSQESLMNKENILDTESIEITVIKASNDEPKMMTSHLSNTQYHSDTSLHVDHNVLRIKALEKLNEELIEQNKSLKQQLLISQSNCSLILNELAKTRKKLNVLIRA